MYIPKSRLCLLEKKYISHTKNRPFVPPKGSQYSGPDFAHARVYIRTWVSFFLRTGLLKLASASDVFEVSDASMRTPTFQPSSHEQFWTSGLFLLFLFSHILRLLPLLHAVFVWKMNTLPFREPTLFLPLFPCLFHLSVSVQKGKHPWTVYMKIVGMNHWIIQ